MALVLSLAKIHIFEDVVSAHVACMCMHVKITCTYILCKVFSFMKEVILRSYKEQERLEASKWMQGMCVVTSVCVYGCVCIIAGVHVCVYH